MAYMSRMEFFAKINLMTEIDDLTEKAYRFAERQEVLQSDKGAAVKDDWHVSFHGSTFPGDSERPCGRQALYRMMDIPRRTGSYMFSNRKLQQIADAGKDIEDRLVMKWYNAGYLVSPPPYDAHGNKQHQFVMESPDQWLTSTVDAITVRPRATRMTVCEVKSKYADVIASMKKLIRGPDDKHVFQIKTQIGLAHEYFTKHPKTVKRCYNTGRLAIEVLLPISDKSRMSSVVEVCPEHLHTDCLHEVALSPPEYGYLYYVSRDNPEDTFEFYIEYDPDFMQKGREELLKWRESFIQGILPQTNFNDKRFAHPFGWKWGEMPCKWCDYGDHCRKDNKKAIEAQKPLLLADSDAVEFAEGIRPGYDLNLVRLAVGQRWEDADLIETCYDPVTESTDKTARKNRRLLNAGRTQH